jgi:hypothetical protein
MTHRLLLIVPLLALTILASACSTLSNFFGSPTGSAVIVAAVDVAVATAEQKGVSAAQINSIARTALAADSGTTATLAAVSALLNNQIAKLNLPAGDLAAAEVLEIALAAAITAKIGTNASVAAAQTQIAVVLEDVIAVTS